MMKNELKVKIRGEVRANYLDADTGKRVVSIWISGESASRMEDKLASMGAEWTSDNFPVKTDEDEDGRTFFKAGSKYPIECMDLVDGESDLDISEVGKGSVVTLYCKIKEGSFNRRSKYVAAYLLGVGVHELTLADDTSVFDSDDFQDADDVPFNDATE